MELSKKQFDLLLTIKKSCDNLEKYSESQIDFLNKTKCISNGKIRKKRVNELLANYKVNNAIILAAGTCTRCRPLSYYCPKSLFEVKGTILIERQINQLIEAGISDIILVVGYKAEMFCYLKKKYGVKLVFNPEYKTTNNISSIWYAKEYLKNSYILGSDNWYEKNIFTDYVYDSYFSTLYCKGISNEYCISIEHDYITDIAKGGIDSWYTLGDIYFSSFLSNKIVSILSTNYETDKKLIIDQFCKKYIDQLKFQALLREENTIYEFDSIEEFVAFDPDFLDFNNNNKTTRRNVMNTEKWWFERYKSIEKYTIQPTETLEGRLQFNENLWGPSPKCLEVLKTIKPSDLNFYDLREKDFLAEAIANLLHLPIDYLFFHCGSSEVIKTILGIMISPDDVALIPKPGWGCYQGMFNAKMAKVVNYSVIEGTEEYYHNIEEICTKAEEYNAKMIVITTPQMPTGNRISQGNLEIILKNNPDRIVLVDECYYGCAEMNLDIKYLIDMYDNVIFVRTLSKIYGLANIRVGYGIARPDMVELIDYLLPLHKLPNVIRKIAVAAIEDTEYTEKNKKEIIASRTWLYTELNKREGVKAFKTYSNFVYAKLEKNNAVQIHDYMSKRGITTRLFDDVNGTYMRITVAPIKIMEKCMELFDEALRYQNQYS